MTTNSEKHTKTVEESKALADFQGELLFRVIYKLFVMKLLL